MYSTGKACLSTSHGKILDNAGSVGYGVTAPGSGVGVEEYLKDGVDEVLVGVALGDMQVDFWQTYKKKLIV